MTTSDLAGGHGRIGSHVHFEALGETGNVIENLHIYQLSEVTMIRLRARVRQVRGGTKHYQGKSLGSGSVEAERLPDAYFVELDQQKDGYFLLRTDESGNFVGDTWHPSLEEAKAQAKFEFMVEDEDWQIR